VSEDPDLLLSQIGLRILRRRQELGWMQKDLAQAVGMQAANVARIEHGQQNLTIRTACKLAEALGMTVAELITGADRSR
jgi:transcriptional regulator with XRE-family HTH domain